MEEVRPGLREEIFEQRGMLSTVISGGVVNVGDEIRVIEGAKAT
jgi:MOSC domain-containing protein YiiM